MSGQWIALPTGHTEDSSSSKRKGEKMKRLRWIWQEDRHLGLVVVLATVMSLASFAFFYSNRLTLLYADAESHLTIAKRVLDSPTPGLAHLGGTWLPLFHVSMLPLVWSDYMYWSGLAGSIVAMASFILATGFIYKIALLLTDDKRAGLVASLVFALNPNLLYMQSTPMWETMIILCMVASVYFLMRWGQDVNKLHYLVATAFAVFLATLTRYENWVLLFAVVVVLLWLFIKNSFTYEKMEGYMIYFGTLAGFGVLIWLVWCQLILGDFLYFYKGEYAHIALHRGGVEAGTGSLQLSLILYSLATKENLGVASCLLGVVGLGYYLISARLKADKVGALILLIPFPFFVAAIYSGNSPVRIPGIAGSIDMFNTRYGLMMLPAVAVFAGYLTRKRRWVKPAVMIVVLAGAVVMFHTDSIITLNDPLKTRREWIGSIRQAEAADWLRSHYDEGFVLMESKGNELITFESRIPLGNFIYEGSEGYWEKALEEPRELVEWVVMNGALETVRGPDKVWEALRENPQLSKNFDLVYAIQGIEIYRQGGSKWQRNRLP